MTTTLTLLILMQLPSAEDPRHMFAAGPAEAYYMEPPEVVSKPYVRRLCWMSDGSTLLVERLVPPANVPPLALANARQTEGLQGMMQFRPRIQLLGWGTRSRLGRTFLDLDSKRARLEEIEPLFNSDQALVTMEETPVRPDGTDGAPVYSYSLLSGATGNLRRLWTGETPPAYLLCTTRSIGALVFGSGQGPKKVALFGIDGKLGNPITLPLKAQFHFSATGLPGVGTIELNAKGKRFYAFHLLDLRTGTLGAVADQQDYDVPEGPLRVNEFPMPGETTGVALRATKGLPGESKTSKKGGKESDESGIVTSDGQKPQLSPKNDAVAFISGQGAFVRTLVKLKRSDYDLAMAEAEKEKAIRTAKQVGLALAMYSGDADDSFPPGGSIHDSVLPYIRNGSMLDSFTYTFGGGTVSGNPSQTELGYVSTTGGRVMVYADGSVKFLPDGA